MNKIEFIEFLTKQASIREHLPHWRKTALNTDDYWDLYRPAVDWLPDDMDLTNEDIVKITYNKGLYSNTSDEFITTYDDFATNYFNTLF